MNNEAIEKAFEEWYPTSDKEPWPPDVCWAQWHKALYIKFHRHTGFAAGYKMGAAEVAELRSGMAEFMQKTTDDSWDDIRTAYQEGYRDGRTEWYAEAEAGLPPKAQP